MNVLVIGASTNPHRYSHMAINLLKQKGHKVFAVGAKEGTVAGISIETDKKIWNDVDTISIYVNPTILKDYYSYIVSLHPRRVIFNPGTESPDFLHALQKNGIEAIDACTLVMLNTGQF